MNNISRGLRLGSMLLDHAIICFIAIPPIIMYNKTFGRDDNFTQYLMIPVFAIYFCKDCFGGRSPAKRILKLSIVNSKTKEVSSPYQSLIRNLFILIWPIEVVVACFNQVRRIGDKVAGTELQYYKYVNTSKVEIGKVIICFLIALFISYVLCEMLRFI